MTDTPAPPDQVDEPDVVVDRDGTLPAWTVRRFTGRSVLSVGIVAVVLAIPMRALLRYQGPPMEEGFMLVFPERILAGDLPHKDFLHLYGPGSLWALAGWYKLVGVSITAERVFGLAQLAGIVFGVMALAWPWGRRVATAAGVLGVLLATTAIGLTALAWNGAVALLVASVWVGLRARRWLTDTNDPPTPAARSRADRLLIWSGVLAGLALLFRPDAIVATGLATLGLLAGLGWGRWKRWLLGAVPIVTLYLVHLALSGPLAAIRGMVIEPVFDLRGGRSLPRPPSWNTFDGALQKVALLRPQLNALGAITATPKSSHATGWVSSSRLTSSDITPSASGALKIFVKRVPQLIWSALYDVRACTVVENVSSMPLRSSRISASAACSAASSSPQSGLSGVSGCTMVHASGKNVTCDRSSMSAR